MFGVRSLVELITCDQVRAGFNSYGHSPNLPSAESCQKGTCCCFILTMFCFNSPKASACCSATGCVASLRVGLWQCFITSQPVLSGAVPPSGFRTSNKHNPTTFTALNNQSPLKPTGQASADFFKCVICHLNRISQHSPYQNPIVLPGMCTHTRNLTLVFLGMQRKDKENRKTD